MKKSPYLLIFACFMLLAPTLKAAEINNKILSEYYRKGKAAYDQQQWLEAIKFLFVYRELNALNKANQQTLSTVDGYIKNAEDALNQKQTNTVLMQQLRSPRVTGFIAAPGTVSDAQEPATSGRTVTMQSSDTISPSQVGKNVTNKIKE